MNSVTSKNVLKIRGSMLSPIIVVLFAIGVRGQNFVYTDNNQPSANSVTAFSVAANGTLTSVGTFPTGGLGSGDGSIATNRARICTAGGRLYVTNDFSNSISGFDINPTTGALTPVPGSPFGRGGPGGIGFSDGISIDCTPDGLFLIAASLNAQNIAVFSVGVNGALALIPGSPFPALGEPHGVRVTPNGKFLSVALRNIDGVGMFSIEPTGALTPVPGSPFASPAIGMAAGVEVNGASNILFASQDTFGGTNVDVFSIGPTGALSLIQSSNNVAVGSGSNVAVLSPNQKFLFVTNQFSGSVTVFNVGPSGQLALLPGSPFIGTGPFPAGEVTNAAGTFLFTANNDGTVTSFSIGVNGNLILVGNFPTGQLSGGLRSLAAFPATSSGVPLTFDVCLQDDSNRDIVFLGNSQTGEYIFCCHGTRFSGTAMVTRRGTVITFQHNTVDRRLLARDDQSVHRGTASLQSPPGSIVCTITDRDTGNNLCACQ